MSTPEIPAPSSQEWLPVVSVAQARADLRDLVRDFHEAGPAAPPVIVGPDGIPQAVIMSYEAWQLLLKEQ